MSDRKTFPIVAIGASAGGLEALTKFIKPIPRETGMAFVVITHMASDQKSNLSSILSRSSAIPVQDIKKNFIPNPNNIYVMAPNSEITFSKGRIEVMKREDNFVHHPIDCFFVALAKSAWYPLIGVVLSGEASDGAFGIQAIKESGGITFAQDPETTTHSSMPQSAIETGAVDLIRSPENIAEEIVRLLAYPDMFGKPPKIEKQKDITGEEQLSKILQLLTKRLGMDFTHYKNTTILRRISRRMILKKVESFPKYFEILKNDLTEIEKLRDDFLIKVSSFFRDKEPFTILTEKIIPDIIKGKFKEGVVRVWVPGCASGEEVYSIAILFSEYLEHNPNKNIEVQIFATDLSEKSIQIARRGIFSQSKLSDISEIRCKDYFTRTVQGDFKIKKSIRDRCVFAVHDVTSDPPFSNLDLVSCRNLLIYFDLGLQKYVLAAFHYSLNPGGYLLLGSSETVGSQEDLFRLIDKKNKIFQRKSTSKKAHVGLFPTSFSTSKNNVAPEIFERSSIYDETELTQRVDNITVSVLSPPGFLVNEDFEIIQYRGNTSPYIMPPHGRASLNLLKVVRNELKAEIRRLVQEAKQNGLVSSGKTFRIPVNGTSKLTRVHVTPIKLTSNQRFILVTIKEIEEEKAKNPPSFRKNGSKREKELALAYEEIQRLERELSELREHTQSVQEEQESANEELNSANEEIISSNEELQSTNEELETAKEELQSSNEELNTVNDELRNRSDELSLINDDLTNIINSSRIPVLILQRDLKIRRFTPNAEKLFRLIPSDIGRPITDIKHQFEDINLKEAALKVVDSIQPFEQEARDETGHWYSIQLKPYLTSDHKISGVVLTALDIDVIKKASNAKDRRLAGILRASSDAIIAHDFDGNILEWNHGAAIMYQFGEDEALLMNIKKLLPSNSHLEYDAYINKLVERDSVSSFETRRKRKDGGIVEVWLTSTIVIDENGKPIAIATTERDLSERIDIEKRKKLELKLEYDKSVAEESNRLKSEFLANVSHEIRTPLAAIVGFSENIVSKNRDFEDLESVEIIKRNATHLEHLVNDILDLAKVEAGKVEFEKRRVSFLNELAENYLCLKRIATEKSIELNFLFDGEIPEKIYTDPIRFRQIMLNIVGNAIKFTTKGKVDITFELSKSEGHRMIQIFVKDTGKGISEEQVGKLFKPFSQVDNTITRKFGGTGLGLALSRHLARALGGNLTLKSSILYKGSTFLITIDPGSLEETKLIKDLDQNQLKITKPIKIGVIDSKYLLGARVLLAEDSEDLQLLTKSLLESRGANVEVAENGKIALDQTRKKSYDLVLMDIQMPVLDGYKATELMRKEGYKGPIVALTARLMKKELDQALKFGCNDALSKPIDQEKLFNMVKNYMK